MNKKGKGLVCALFYAYVSCLMAEMPLEFEVALGLGNFNTHVTNEPNVAVGRFSMGFLFLDTQWFDLGLALGFQNGANFRLNISESVVKELGGVGIDAQIKPMLDVLLTLDSAPLFESPIHLFLKGGAVYRTLRVDVHDMNALSKGSPEFQAGLSYMVNPQWNLHLGYQVMLGESLTTLFGESLDTIFSTDGNSGQLNGIPQFNAILLGASFIFA